MQAQLPVSPTSRGLALRAARRVASVGKCAVVLTIDVALTAADAIGDIVARTDTWERLGWAVGLVLGIGSCFIGGGGPLWAH